MCGIAGYLGTDAVRRERIDAMVAALRHRGPDASGVLRDPEAVFGHARLSIIDLAETGAQPMESACGRYLAVLNGEIYNYTDLRRELIADGHAFRGTSDTEVLVEAFARRGPDVVPDLRGMFALAIWDRTERRLHLARDHFGKKPLYLHEPGPGELCFASELRSLRAVCTTGFDPSRLGVYFRYGYVPEPATIWRDVRTLPPAHRAVWTPEDGLRMERYWSPAAPTAERAPVDLDELDALLRRAVERRMMSDVPLGAFLSGGVDSALIASYLTELRPGAPTITVGFDAARWDESPAAAETAALMDTRHLVEIVGTPDAEAMLDRYVQCYDQPFADSSGVPTLVLSEATRRHVTVALGGDGGDEIFGGYDRYAWMRTAVKARRLAGPLRGLAAPLLRLVPRRGRRLADLMRAPDEAAVYEILCRVWHHGPVDALLKVPHDPPERWFRERYERLDGTGSVRAQLFDILHELPDDILVKVDRATMRHGLEARSPLLDVDVVEWSLRTGLLGDPAQHGKQVLRDLLARRLPGFDFSRPKRGFALPVERWLAGPLAARLDRAADPDLLAAQGLFDAGEVARTVAGFRAGRAELYSPLWAFLVFQEWVLAEGVTRG